MRCWKTYPIGQPRWPIWSKPAYWPNNLVGRSGWRITQRVMLLWLADELMRVIRTESAFARWLQSAELEGRWTQGQREQLIGAIKSVGYSAIKLIDELVLKIESRYE